MAIVVGYDGSRAADLALDWAMRHASRSRARVRLVCAWSAVELSATVPALDAALMQSLHQGAKAAVDKGLRSAHERDPSVDVSGAVHTGQPAAVLLHESRGADMVVVGTRREDGLLERLLGSVSRQVATHSSCPAVVVRPDPGADDGRVVVGADGSEHSVRALGFAADHAARHDLTLEVIHTWSLPAFGSLSAVPTFSPPEAMRDTEETERRATAEAVGGVREDHPDLELQVRTVRGDPVTTLREASGRARLLVVGTRGRGGFTGLLLGSVSHSLAHRAECSVAVIP